MIPVADEPTGRELVRVVPEGVDWIVLEAADGNEAIYHLSFIKPEPLAPA
jgi:hypothetical protein